METKNENGDKNAQTARYRDDVKRNNVITLADWWTVFATQANEKKK